MKRGYNIFLSSIIIPGMLFSGCLTGLASDMDSDQDSNSKEPVVYFTSDISPESLMSVYQMLDWTPSEKTAVKISTGEPPASNYLRPELIKDLVQGVDGTIVECNTAYGGSRAQTAMHYQVAEDHGFTDIADFQILDEDGSMTLEVNGGSVLAENYVGKAFADYDSYLILSHFKGHSMAGFGGAIKIYPSVLVQAKGKPGSIAGEQAVRLHGAGSRMLFWKRWQKRANQFRIISEMESVSSM